MPCLFCVLELAGALDDAADAEAIVVAAQRPEMRFVPPKTEEQQARAVLFRARERLVHQRTELINALRATLYEYGYVVPQGTAHLKRLVEIIETETSDLPELAREEARDLIEQIAEKTDRIDAKARKIAAQAALTPTARRLQTMPGVGPMTALAVEAFAPAMETFKCGRDFAAWLGLVPRQMSSGGKERLGRVSKAGQSDIRRLLIIGAMSRLNWLGQRTIVEGSWLSRMLMRKPKMLVAIAWKFSRLTFELKCNVVPQKSVRYVLLLMPVTSCHFFNQNLMPVLVRSLAPKFWRVGFVEMDQSQVLAPC